MKNIFVGNLSYGTTEESVRSLFEQYGTVERAKVVTDRETGESKGFGFVEMTDDAAADKAIASMNGHEVTGRALTVNEARPKGSAGNGRGVNGGGFKTSVGDFQSGWLSESPAYQRRMIRNRKEGYAIRQHEDPATGHPTGAR